MTDQILLTADWVVPITGDPIADGAVLVEDGAISAVGARADVQGRARPDALRKDFGHAALLPGLINAHTHIEETVFRGLADTESFIPWLIALTKSSGALTYEQHLTSARLGALEAVRSGTTTIADVGTDGSSVVAATEAGIRAVVFHNVKEPDPKGPSRGLLERVSDAVAAYRQNAGPLIQIGLFPDAPYSVSPESYRALCHWAWGNNMLLATHLATGSAESEFVKYGSTRLATEYREMMGWGDILWQPMGCTPVKYLEQWDVLDGPLIAMNVAKLSDEDLDLMLSYGVKVVPCPRSSAKLGAGTPPLGRLHRRNMPRALGTDTVAASNNMDMFDEMRISLLLHRGSSERLEFGLVARDFLQMATMGGANVLGIDHLVGSLETGKRADIIAVDLSGSHQTPVREIESAIVYAANEEDVIFSMVDGSILFEDGASISTDSGSVRAAVDELRSQL